MASTSRLPRRLRVGFLVAAVLLFWNPIVAIIDPLPDFVAYLLLWWGLGYLADLHTHLAEARGGFLRMALIDALKPVALLFLVTVPVAEEQPSTQLLLTFVFSVIELIYAIPAWNHLFDGLFGLISNDGDLRRYDLPRRGGDRSLFELCRGMTLVWIIARATLATLPELTALSAFEYEGYVTNRDIDIYSFRGLFVLMAVVVMFVFGILWLVRMLRLTARLVRDEQLLAALHIRYTETVSPNHALFLRRRIRLGLGVLTFASLLALDFYVEEANLIPDILAAAAMLLGIFILRKCVKRWQMPIWLGAVWGVASVVSTICANAFHSEFYPALVYKNSEAYAAYRLMCSATIVEQFTFALTVLAVGWTLMAMLRRLDESLCTELRGKVIGWCVIGVLSAICGVLYDLLLPSVEFIWLIDFGVGLLFAGYAWKELDDVYTTVAESLRDGLLSNENEREAQHEYLH